MINFTNSFEPFQMLTAATEEIMDSLRIGVAFQRKVDRFRDPATSH